MNQNDKPPTGTGIAGAVADRKARLAAELRKNLKKRKAQQRQRGEPGDRPAASDDPRPQ